MKRIVLTQGWCKKTDQIAVQPALRGYRHNLEDRMSAASTIESSHIELSFFSNGKNGRAINHDHLLSSTNSDITS